jgi:hypothetical protein
MATGSTGDHKTWVTWEGKNMRIKKIQIVYHISIQVFCIYGADRWPATCASWFHHIPSIRVAHGNIRTTWSTAGVSSWSFSRQGNTLQPQVSDARLDLFTWRHIYCAALHFIQIYIYITVTCTFYIHVYIDIYLAFTLLYIIYIA